VDRQTVLLELNLTGACLLGIERDLPQGRTLDSFLSPDSARELRAMFDRIDGGAAHALADLQLRSHDGSKRHVHAGVRPDPGGGRFLITLLEACAPPP
jgi:hypothetical protein